MSTPPITAPAADATSTSITSATSANTILSASPDFSANLTANSTEIQNVLSVSASLPVQTEPVLPSQTSAMRPSASPPRITRHDSRNSPIVQHRPRSVEGGSVLIRPTFEAKADSKTVSEEFGSSSKESGINAESKGQYSVMHQIAEYGDKDECKDGDHGHVRRSAVPGDKNGGGDGEEEFGKGEDKDFCILDALESDAKYEETLKNNRNTHKNHNRPEEKERKHGGGGGTDATALAADSSAGQNLFGKSKHPVLFLAWDGEPDSVENVEKLKRFLKAKGYIIFEHSGGDCSGSQARIAGFDATTLQTSNSVDSLDASPMALGVGVGGDGLGGMNASVESSVSALKAGASGVAVGVGTPAPSVATGGGSASASARAKVSQALVDQMTISTVFVSCVTRAFTKNMNCKKMVLRMRELQIELGPKRAAEMLYVMIHGTFTTDSYPYHCRSGWLGYFLRDSLWSPAWNHAHAAGAAEAIASTVNLRRNVVRLNPLHVLYIETRGQKGVCPPSQIG
jgi:hypothetical protein